MQLSAQGKYTFSAVSWKWSGIRILDGLEISFHEQGAVKEKVLERDFVPLYDGTTRRHSFTDCRIWDGMKTHKRK